jgi:hypothetical protein
MKNGFKHAVSTQTCWVWGALPIPNTLGSGCVPEPKRVLGCPAPLLGIQRVSTPIPVWVRPPCPNLYFLSLDYILCFLKCILKEFFEFIFLFKVLIIFYLDSSIIKYGNRLLVVGVHRFMTETSLDGKIVRKYLMTRLVTGKKMASYLFIIKS